VPLPWVAAGGVWGGHWGIAAEAAVVYGSRQSSNLACNSRGAWLQPRRLSGAREAQAAVGSS